MERRLRFRTASSGETKRVAEWLANDLAGILFHDHALVIALSGDLGSGKTTFVQGFARGLGVRDSVASPTFAIARMYPIQKKHYRKLIHVDAYRLGGSDEIQALGWNDWVKNPNTVILIEWLKNILTKPAERLLPKIHFDIHFEHSFDTKRIITLHVNGI